MTAILDVDLSACRSAIKVGADINWCLQSLFKVINSNVNIVNQGQNNSCNSNQILLIDYLMSLDVNEDIIKQGLSILRSTGDKRQIALLNGICSKLEKKYSGLFKDSNALNVQFGRIIKEYTEKNVFMVFLESNEFIEDRSFAGKDVLFRNLLRPSYEGIQIALSPLVKDNPLSEDDHMMIRETINREGKWLWAKHTNLNIISACSVKSKQNGKDQTVQPCIVLYCTCKGFIPKFEPKFPKALQSQKGSIMVDIREGCFNLGCGKRPSDWNSPLRIGGSVGVFRIISAGTVGPFVALQQDKIGFLTCAHVLADFQMLQQNSNNNNVTIHMVAVQPSDADFTCVPNGETKDCGIVRTIMFDDSLPTGIDAAVVEITHRHPNRGLFAFRSELELREAGNVEKKTHIENGNIY